MPVEVISTGAINWDVNLFVDTLNPGGVEIPVNKLTRVPGGKAANVAVASARLLGKGKAGILGAVGNDEIGSKQKEIFEREGVDTSGLVFLDSAESGQAYILIDPKGRNQIYTHFGANAYLRPDFLMRKEVLDAIGRAKIIVAMDPPLDYTESLFRRVAEKEGEEGREEKKVVWAPGVRSLGHEQDVIRLLTYVDYLVLNEQELKGLTYKETPEEGYSLLANHSSRVNLVATLGEKGAMLIGRGKKLVAVGIDLEKIGRKVVNTVGCGDAFIGCFASSLVEGYSEEESLVRANAAGAFKATQLQTRGSPTSSELQAFMERLKNIP
ncbi:MAG: carbohydrate kinase family protein [Conexivisphaerales archaeon]